MFPLPFLHFLKFRRDKAKPMRLAMLSLDWRECRRHFSTDSFSLAGNLVWERMP